MTIKSRYVATQYMVFYCAIIGLAIPFNVQSEEKRDPEPTTSLVGTWAQSAEPKTPVTKGGIEQSSAAATTHPLNMIWQFSQTLVTLRRNEVIEFTVHYALQKTGDAKYDLFLDDELGTVFDLHYEHAQFCLRQKPYWTRSGAAPTIWEAVEPFTYRHPPLFERQGSGRHGLEEQALGEQGPELQGLEEQGIAEQGIEAQNLQTPRVDNAASTRINYTHCFKQVE